MAKTFNTKLAQIEGLNLHMSFGNCHQDDVNMLQLQPLNDTTNEIDKNNDAATEP